MKISKIIFLTGSALLLSGCASSLTQAETDSITTDSKTSETLLKSKSVDSCKEKYSSVKVSMRDRGQGLKNCESQRTKNFSEARSREENREE